MTSPATAIPARDGAVVILQSNDHVDIAVDRRRVVRQSQLLHNLLPPVRTRCDAGDEEVAEGEGPPHFPLPRVASRELAVIARHVDSACSACEKEQQVVQLPIAELVALFVASDYLMMRGLGSCCARAIALRVSTAWREREWEGAKVKELLFHLVPPQLPSELCAMWLSWHTKRLSTILPLAALSGDALLEPLARCRSLWVHSDGRPRRFALNLANDRAVRLVQARLKCDPANTAVGLVQRTFIRDASVLSSLVGLTSLDIGRGRNAAMDSRQVALKALPLFSETLTLLNLRHCHFSLSTGMESLSALRNLAVLDLRHTHFHGEHLAALAPLSNLTDLDISGWCNIDNKGLAWVSTLKSLVSVRLSHARFVGDEGVHHLEGLPHLASLELAGCSRITDAALRHLPTTLKLLDVGQCGKITDAGLAHLAKLTQLTSLNLGGCYKITGTAESLTPLTQLTQLVSLDLKSCNVRDAAVPGLKRLPRLTTLSLAKSSFLTDSGIGELASLTSLTKLTLDSCTQITDAGIVRLTPLEKLRELELRHCNVTSASIAQLPMFRGIPQ